MGWIRIERRDPVSNRPTDVIEIGTDPLSDTAPRCELQQHIEHRDDWTRTRGPDHA